MNKNTWEVVEDCNDENNNATCWSKEINHKKYGKFVWITDNGNGYNVEVISNDETIVLKECKSLASAKRWVTSNLI